MNKSILHEGLRYTNARRCNFKNRNALTKNYDVMDVDGSIRRCLSGDVFLRLS